MMIGIDFGTTNSSLAIYRPTGAEMIETVDGEDFMPSVVADTGADGIVTGKPASNQLMRNPEFTFRNIKRFLGTPFSEQEHGQIHLAEGPDGKVWWRGQNGTLLSGPILVAEVLKSLVLAAELRLGKKPTGAVIAVPVDFREPQRDAIREAAALAGLKKVELFEEPYCAALAYGLERSKFQRVLVYDFGGGTFDATVLRIKAGNTKALGMGGSAQLGGADFDKRLADHCIDEFFKREGEDLRAYPKQIVRIQAAAEDAKKILSRMERVTIEQSNVAFPKSGLANLQQDVTRAEFETMTEDLVVRTIASVRDAMTQAGMTDANGEIRKDQIDAVLLVGGQSRMPLIRDVLEGMFGKRKIVMDGPRAEHAVALGAAIRAAELDGRIRPTVMQRLVPSSVGLRVSGGGFYSFVKRGETFPVRRERIVRAAAEGQGEIELIVLQGEAADAADNTEVWACALPIGDGERVPVMIDIATDGRLKVWIAGQVAYGAEAEAEVVDEEEAA